MPLALQQFLVLLPILQLVAAGPGRDLLHQCVEASSGLLLIPGRSVLVLPGLELILHLVVIDLQALEPRFSSCCFSQQLDLLRTGQPSKVRIIHAALQNSLVSITAGLKTSNLLAVDANKVP